MNMVQENIIQVGKYNINYIKVGHGEHSVLCMPGALGSIWTDFEPQIEGFDREKFSLIIWDPPGYGKSIPPEREFHSDYYGQDVDIAVEFMKALNILKFSVMGWCYGGVAGIILAAKYPEVVRKLIVWGARAYILPNQVEIYKKMEYISEWSEKMIKPRLELYGLERFVRLGKEIGAAVETLYHTNNGRILCTEVLKKVNCPTLIFHGEKDIFLDETNVNTLHTNIKGSRLHVYPEGKHNVHLRYAEDFNQKARDFLLHS